MQITQINYQKTFNIGSYQSIKLGAEMSINEGENAEEGMDTLRKFVHEYFTKHAPTEAFEQTGEQVRDIAEPGGNDNSKSRQINSIREAINSATTLKTVEIFRKLVERENIPEITTIFEEKLKTFA